MLVCQTNTADTSQVPSVEGTPAAASPHQGFIRAMMSLAASTGHTDLHSTSVQHPAQHGTSLKLKYLSKLNSRHTRSAPKTSARQRRGTGSSHKIPSVPSYDISPPLSFSSSTPPSHVTSNEGHNVLSVHSKTIKKKAYSPESMDISYTSSISSLHAPKRSPLRAPGDPLFMDDFFRPPSSSPSSRPIRIPSRLSKEEQQEASKLRGEFLRYRMRPRHVPLAIARAGEATYEFEGGEVPLAHLPSPPLDFSAPTTTLPAPFPDTCSTADQAGKALDDSLHSSATEPFTEESDGSGANTSDDEQDEQDSFFEEIFQLDDQP